MYLRIVKTPEAIDFTAILPGEKKQRQIQVPADQLQQLISMLQVAAKSKTLVFELDVQEVK